MQISRMKDIDQEQAIESSSDKAEENLLPNSDIQNITIHGKFRCPYGLLF